MMSDAPNKCDVSLKVCPTRKWISFAKYNKACNLHYLSKCKLGRSHRQAASLATRCITSLK